MIAAAKKCGCPIKSDFKTSENFETDFSPSNFQQYSSFHTSKTNLEKCLCSSSNDPDYETMNGNCDICCESVTENESKELIENEKSKVVSEIVKKGLPYKEIEVIINNNRMIIRVQKDQISKDEWNPSCECIDESKKSSSNQQNSFQNRNDVIFRKVDSNQCLENRTITVYPEAESEVQELNIAQNQEGTEVDSKMDINKIGPSETDKKSHQKIRSIDLEENPNIFLLRIKKRCENGDGKYNLDLEFRTPRPWLPKPIVEKPPTPPPPPPEPVSEIESKGKKEKKNKGKKGKKKK